VTTTTGLPVPRSFFTSCCCCWLAQPVLTTTRSLPRAGDSSGDRGFVRREPPLESFCLYAVFLRAVCKFGYGVLSGEGAP
jgi:hypothetical protein